jgi:hypothetical protein
VSSITFCNGPSLTVSGNNIELSGGTINGLAGLLVNYEYNTQLSSVLSTTRGGYIDASGYSLSITPGSTQSKIRVMYRALVRSSDEPYSRISFRVLYDISGGVSGELCSDASYGFPNRLSLYPDPLTSIYTVDTIHSPATTDRITYSLQYSIESSGGDVSTSIPIGILESSANSIILEELNGTGTTGPSIWTKEPGNSISYTGTTTTINSATVINDNLYVSGDISLNCGSIYDVSSIYFCDGTYIGPGGSFDISTVDILKITSSDFTLNNSFYQVNVSGNKHYYGFNEANPQKDYVFATDETYTTLALYNKNKTASGELIISFRNDISGIDLSFIETGAIRNTIQDLSHTVFKMHNFRGGTINNFMTVDGCNNRIDLSAATVKLSDDLELDGNIQINSGGTGKLVFNDGPNDHRHAEIDAEGDGSSGGIIKFLTKVDGSGGAVTEKMRITNDGNVGIGTNNPTQTLDVSGNIISNKIYVKDAIIHDSHNISTGQIETIVVRANNICSAINTPVTLATNLGNGTKVHIVGGLDATGASSGTGPEINLYGTINTTIGTTTWNSTLSSGTISVGADYANGGSIWIERTGGAFAGIDVTLIITRHI